MSCCTMTAPSSATTLVHTLPPPCRRRPLFIHLAHQNRSNDEKHPSLRVLQLVGSVLGVFVQKTRKGFGIMKVVAVPCLEDNYAYLVFDEGTGDAVAIDPVWPDEVLQAAQVNGVKVKMVLTTHHHWDHAGGNNGMKKLLKDVAIYGGVKDKVEGCSHPVQHGDEFSISPSIRVKCLETPCHTKGHISYFITSSHAQDKPAVFTGDTLFIGGCGRFFEGTPDQMYNSLCKTLASLPPETEVYCGHEYTEKNLEFALTLEPKNEALVKKMEWVLQQRQRKLPTVPSTIGDELEFNPFMRVDNKSLQLATGRESPLEVMAEVRRMKDNFKGKISVL